MQTGTLQVGDGGTRGTLGSGAVTNDSILSFNRSNALDVSNVISGSGVLNQKGSGTLSFSGDNTYGGGTVIEAGFVIANNMGGGSALGSGDVIVKNGGGLGGSGTVGAFVTVQNGGTISPGNSPGTLTVDSLAFDPGSTLTIELAGVADSLFDQLIIENDATLGGILDVSYFDTFTAQNGDLFTILQAGNLNGEFDNFIAPDSQNWQVQYDTINNRVQIGVIPEPSTVSFLVLGLLGVLRRKR